MAETPTTNGAENIFWDLSDLYASTDEKGLGGDLATIEQRSKDFRDRWYGKFASLSIVDFMTMVQEYEQLVENYDRMGSYVHLQWSTDSEHPEYGKLMQCVTETLCKA